MCAVIDTTQLTHATESHAVCTMHSRDTSALWAVTVPQWRRLYKQLAGIKRIA